MNNIKWFCSVEGWEEPDYENKRMASDGKSNIFQPQWQDLNL
jgi:hypothetical protein